MPKADEDFKGFDDDIIYEDDFEEEEDETEVEEDETDDKVETEPTEDESQTEEDSDEHVKTQEELEAEKAEEQHKRNEEFKAKRLAREKKEREEREKRIAEQAKLEGELKGKLSAIKENPYTNEKIVDEEDLKIYEIQKQLDEDGLDPVSDLPKRLAELRRKERAKEEAEKKAKDELDELYKIDREQFQNAYPNVSLDELENEEEFIKFAEGKKGRWTLKEIYEAYSNVKEKNSAKKREAMTETITDDMSKKMTRVPSSRANGSKQTVAVLDMSDEEYLKREKEKSGDFF